MSTPRPPLIRVSRTQVAAVLADPGRPVLALRGKTLLVTTAEDVAHFGGQMLVTRADLTDAGVCMTGGRLSAGAGPILDALVSDTNRYLARRDDSPVRAYTAAGRPGLWPPSPATHSALPITRFVTCPDLRATLGRSGTAVPETPDPWHRARGFLLPGHYSAPGAHAE